MEKEEEAEGRRLEDEVKEGYRRAECGMLVQLLRFDEDIESDRAIEKPRGGGGLVGKDAKKHGRKNGDKVILTQKEVRHSSSVFVFYS